MKKVVLIGYGRFGKILYEKLSAMNIADIAIATHDYQKHLSGADWAVIATPMATHVEIARNCLDAGLDVFCEKPLSEDPKAVEDVFNLARTKNKKIYVDDVFLWRAEYAEIKKLNPKLESISFRMTKYGTFNDSLLAAHVYHDLYLLLDLTGFAPISDIKILRAECPIEPNRVDVLEFSCQVGTAQVHGFYDRTQETKQKITTVNDSIVWSDNSLAINDALKSLPDQDAITKMLRAVLSEETDFLHNNKLAFETTRVLAKIKDRIV